MENFVVSARKYRPATFHTVVGQSSITNTLKNAIKNNHLAQAFLFCGPRGVGKTTCARILAKTINCQNVSAETEACNECESCRSFNSGQSLNVYELDAASNNSVEDIRNLVEQVRFAPQSGKYKVYIIDEVHMLSNQAFNAFLKTLEEPPKYAIFILATTEKPKIIPTILSRCQIFDFNRIQVDDIANHLAYIAKSEQVSAEPEALHVIAQKADGALRDACSIFDQIVSSAGSQVTYKSVIDNLNILDYDYYFQVTDLLLKGDLSGVLLVFNEILQNGFDGHLFINGLAEHLRNLLVGKDPSTVQLLEVSSTVKERYLKQCSLSPAQFLMRGISILSQADLNYKQSRNQRLLVELTLMQLSALTSGTGENEKKNDFPEPIAAVKSVSTPVSGGNSSSIAVAATDRKVEVDAEQKVSGTKDQPSMGGSTLRRSALKTSAPTISGIINDSSSNKAQGDSAEKHTSSLSQNTSQPFTQLQLEAAWEQMAKHMEKKGKYNLYTTLLFKKPVLLPDWWVEFTVDNLVQQEAIEQEKIELSTLLRNALQNFNVQLKIIISPPTVERKPYTPSDKFKEMAKKNPTLIKLKQVFDLDIDH